MTYLWKILDDYPERLIGEYDRSKGPDRFLFKQGRRLESEANDPTFRFKCKPKDLKSLDDLANNAMVPLVSDRVAALLLRICPNDVELVNSTVVADGKPVQNYRIVNAVHKVEGIDHQASEYSLVPGTKAIMKIRKMRYHDGCLGDFDLARDAEFLSNLLVSKRLHDAMSEEGLRGIGLYLPSDMAWT